MTILHEDGSRPPVTRKRGQTTMVANGVMLLAAMAWGSGNVSQKLILENLDPFAANGLTSLIGAIALVPLARREAKRTLPPMQGGMGLLVQVALAFTVAATLMQIGYGHTTVTNAGFLVNTAAVLTPVLVWVLYGQRPAFWIWPASLCSLAGVFLMGGGGLSNLVLGDMVALSAAVVFAFWTLLVGRFVTYYRRPALLTVVQLAVCGGVCLLVGIGLYGPPTGLALRAALPEIMYLGLVSKGLAYSLMAMAQAHVPPTCAAVLVSAEAVFGAIAANLFLGEIIGPHQYLGGGLIIVGVTIAAFIPVRNGATAHSD